MFPVTELQAWHTLPGVYTLAFVKVQPDANVSAVRRAVEKANPRLATIATESDFGRVDRNLVLITAANVGGSILALFIGATGVMNTSLLSFYERIREFGLLRATGWNRRRLFGLVLGEALLVSFVGAAAGVVIGFVAVEGLTHVPRPARRVPALVPHGDLRPRARVRVRDGGARRVVSRGAGGATRATGGPAA